MLLPVSDVNVDVTCFDHDERSEASTTRTKGAPQRYFHKHPKTKEVCFKPERKDKSISPCATRGPSASIMREPESQTHTSLPLLPAEGDFYPRSIPEHWKCIPMDEDETMKTRDPVRHRNWRGHPSRRGHPTTHRAGSQTRRQSSSRPGREKICVRRMAASTSTFGMAMARRRGASSSRREMVPVDCRLLIFKVAGKICVAFSWLPPTSQF